MRLGGKARYLCEVGSEQKLHDAVHWAGKQNMPFIVIGGGSNIIWRDEGFNGLVIINCITGKQILQDDGVKAVIKVGSGENWDEVVVWTVGQGLSGLEFLSAIPGKAGGAPVQNIGAYGQELSNVLKEVSVYDSKEDAFGSIQAEACGFAYRTSRFKTTDKKRFLITSLTIELTRKNPEPPFYESLQKYFEEHHITNFTPSAVREAVVAIRKTKLPDPKFVANNGSFFTNPFVSQEKFEQLRAKYPDIKGWPCEDGRVKLAAGWLVEQAGFRGVHDEETGMATNPDQALVLINEHAKNTADLLKFKQKIVNKVEEMFGVTLEQEPELLP